MGHLASHSGLLMLALLAACTAQGSDDGARNDGVDLQEPGTPETAKADDGPLDETAADVDANDAIATDPAITDPELSPADLDGLELATSPASILPGTPSAWKLTFRDEFDAKTIDKSKWNTTLAWGDRSLSSNKELECYGDNNFVFGSGTVALVARRGAVSCPKPAFTASYSSGVLASFGKFSQKFGYFELRAKIPKGKGLWPAFWLLPQSYAWPPELDVFEFIGDPQRIYQTLHWKDAAGNHQMKATNSATPDASQTYHYYGVSWRPNLIVWYVDGKETMRVASSNVPQTAMYVLLNLAVGGWAGTPPSTTKFPAAMTLSFFRAYQCTDWSKCGK